MSKATITTYEETGNVQAKCETPDGTSNIKNYVVNNDKSKGILASIASFEFINKACGIEHAGVEVLTITTPQTPTSTEGKAPIRR